MPDTVAHRGALTSARPRAQAALKRASASAFSSAYDDRFAREYGLWRPVVGQVADKCLAGGILEYGFARVPTARHSQ